MMNRIYFPSSMGQRKAGVDLTSKYLFKFFGKNAIVVKTKNTQASSESVRKSTLSSNLIKLNYANNYANRMVKGRTINIGGDHSMAIATIGASLYKYGSQLKVIWFDAHADINTRQTSPSGNYHGMPLAFLTQLDKDDTMFPFLQSVQQLNFENILYLGIRDLDSGEKKVLAEKKIKFIKSKDINKNPTKIYETIREFVGNSPVYFSFDVDGIDPEEMPCTGTTAINGVHVNAIKPIVDGIMENLNVVGMDITEFNINLGTKAEKETSIKNFMYLFEKYLSA